MTLLRNATVLMALASTAHAQCPVSFDPAVNYLSGTRPGALAAGDFNSDGRPDLAVTNTPAGPTSYVSILLASPNGTFQTAGSYPVTSGAWYVAVGDFNTDGSADLAVVSTFLPSVQGLSILLGNGNGTFQAAVSYPLPLEAVFVAVGEFNADGNPDLVVTGWGPICILLGNGDGTFQAAVSYAIVGDAVFSVGIGDFNADGSADLAALTTYPSDVSVLLGNGNGTLQAAVVYSTGGNAQWVAVADFNADGRLDLSVTINESVVEGIVRILPGNGDGTFQAAVGYPSDGKGRIAVGDFNADGRPDLAIGSVPGSYWAVHVLLGNSNGTFQPPVNFAAGAAYPLGVAVGDFNADGRPDIATANGYINGSYGDGSVSVLLNTSPFHPGDLNGDGAVSLQDLAILLAHFGDAGDPSDGDLDADGDVDIQDLANLLANFGTTCS